MWTPTTPAQHSRAGLRYGSGLGVSRSKSAWTDAEWAVLEPLLPQPCSCGRPRRWPLREVINAISYVLRCSCPWRFLPKDLPPWRTAYRWFARLWGAGAWQALNFVLVMAVRERSGRSASPSAAVMDSQSVRTTESGGPCGYDAGKKVWGRKRHALVDMDGCPLALQAGPASVQDRDGAVPLLKALRSLHPFLQPAFADGGYAGKRVATATLIVVEIVRKQAGQVGLAVQPRRWVVERTFTCLAHGLAATGTLPETPKRPSRLQQPSSMPLPPCRLPEGSDVAHEFRDRP